MILDPDSVQYMIDTGTQSSSVFQIISFYMDSTVLLIDYQLTVMFYVVIINRFNQLSIVNVYHINHFNGMFLFQYESSSQCFQLVFK